MQFIDLLLRFVDQQILKADLRFLPTECKNALITILSVSKTVLSPSRCYNRFGEKTFDVT